jgi:hypothetical protein
MKVIFRSRDFAHVEGAGLGFVNRRPGSQPWHYQGRPAADGPTTRQPWAAYVREAVTRHASPTANGPTTRSGAGSDRRTHGPAAAL